ncbi:putative endonuclease-reverse transcriptase [Trichonephila clavipes]|nr:putative endonuclease-reverse transcriptase [Trichonephila clavipes]
MSSVHRAEKKENFMDILKWQRSKIGTLKAFQCNTRIVMAQRKHLDDFLRGRIIGRLECGRTQLEVSEELGIAQSVISRLWQRFQDDETWPLTLRDEEALGISERKILRCIIVGIQVNGSWKRKSSLKRNKICKQPDIVKFVKLQRLKWTGHLARMNEDRCSKKIFLAKPMGNRSRGRPPLRWIDCIEKDLNIFKDQKLENSCEK